MKLFLSFLTTQLATIFVICLSFGINSNALGQDKSNREKTKSNQDVEISVDDESVLGFDEVTSERLLSSLRKGAFSKNASVSYHCLKMFSDHPDLHQGLGEGVQLELVKQALKQDFTISQGFEILVQSEIKGIEREELLLESFKFSFRERSKIDRKLVLAELSTVSESLIDRFIMEIENDPLGNHTDKLLVIEHFGSSAEKALPALLKRYRALKELAANEGRAANYMDVLFAVGEIQSKDGMEIILDAINERGGSERERYALVGFECLKRIVDAQYVGDANDGTVDKRYLKYAQSLVRTYDKNSDGLLSRDEMSKMRRPPKISSDRNGDQKISERELAQSLTGDLKSQRVSSSRSRTRNKELIRNSVRFD